MQQNLLKAYFRNISRSMRTNSVWILAFFLLAQRPIGNAQTLATKPSSSYGPNNRVNKLASIRDFGRAAGDGSDASAAFSAAMASTNSPVISIPAGTYGLLPNLYDAASAVSFIGASSGRSIIQLPRNCILGGVLFRWINRNDFRLNNLTIDLNGCTVSKDISYPVQITGGVRFEVSRNSIIHARNQKSRSGWILIGVNGASKGVISHNYLSISEPSSWQNQGILISSSYRTSDSILLFQNTLVNTAIEASGKNLRILANNISRWGFGGGIVLDSVEVETNDVISSNIVHDSEADPDENKTYANGIENWAAYSYVEFNKIYNTASSGIYMGAQHQTVRGNSISGAGRRSDNAGQAAIEAGHRDATFNASFGIVENNSIQADNNGKMLYGYHSAPGITSVLLRCNKMYRNKKTTDRKARVKVD